MRGEGADAATTAPGRWGLGGCEPQLKVHIGAALNVGISREEICEALLHSAVYCGFPKALNATFAARAGGEGGVERFGEAAVDRAVEQGLADLLSADADVERGADVDLELGLAAAQGGEGTEGDQLAAARIEARPVVDVSEGEGGDVVAHGRADVRQRVDDGLAAVAVDAHQHILSVAAPLEVLR